MDECAGNTYEKKMNVVREYDWAAFVCQSGERSAFVVHTLAWLERE